MSFYKIPISIITAISITQPQLFLAQNINKINNIAENITVKITGYGNGSGVIFEKAGNVYSVVTNKHVVLSINTNYEILTYDGTKHQVISRIEIPNLDLAIVKFQSNKNYQLAKIEDSDSINRLQIIYVAGFPGKQTHIDIISGEIRSIAEGNKSQQGYALTYTNQTLPGSSGGAVLDEKGNLIGINGLGKRDLQTGRDISRGIPINLFLAAKDRLRVNQATNPNLPNPGQVNFGQYQLAYTTNALHSDEVNSVAVSGDKIVSGSSDSTIKVWNLNTGQLERTLEGHSSSVRSVAVSGDKIVSGSSDKNIKIWNLKTGQLERTLEGHSHEVGSVAVNGDKIVSGSWDKNIKIWNLNTGQLERTLQGHSRLVNSVAVSGDKIVSGSWDRTIKVWNLNTGQLERTLQGDSSGVDSVGVSGDKIVNIGSWQRTIKVWNLNTGQLERSLYAYSSVVFSMVVNRDKIVSGSEDGTIKIWNLNTGQLERTLEGHSSWVNSVAVSGDKIISGSGDRTIKVWQLQR